jgi:hypothetical protein
VQYEVSYACDPFNEIKDGGGNDDIRVPTWGQPTAGTGLVVNPTTGLWKVEVDVYVPLLLLNLGETNFRFYLNTLTGGNGEANNMIYHAVTRQFGDGWVGVVVLDQTACQIQPIRPATYNFFRKVRPGIFLPPGTTWRDCGLSGNSAYLDTRIDPFKDRLPLSQGAMSSLGGVAVRKHFRLTLNPTGTPEIVCSGK